MNNTNVKLEKKSKKENEKVTYWKLGNLRNLRNIIPGFLISEFSVCPTAKIENSDLKISGTNFRDFQGFHFSTWPSFDHFKNYFLLIFDHFFVGHVIVNI